MSDSEEVSSGAELQPEGQGEGGEERQQYANKCELMLSLIGYAVGLGNVWRFPYLAYTYGGAAFLIPYFVALLCLGLPLFILELGLGQLYRQGTLGVWKKLGRPRLKGVGVAATVCTFLVSLYYCTILAWTLYYVGATIVAAPSGIVPWSHLTEGFVCPETVLYPSVEVANNPDLYDAETNLFNPTYRKDFWCPPFGIPSQWSEYNQSLYVQTFRTPTECPARAAVKFWEESVLQQTSGMDVLGGFQPGLLLAHTVTWILVYFIIFQGVGSSGKVVYVTATLPYVALFAFLIRGLTLPNAMTGLKFFLIPDLSKLLNAEVWQRAVTQIFYSLGVGFGSLIAFASYGAKNDDYIGNAIKVSSINCGTSVLAGFVVFPILGYLAHEMKNINPCFAGDNLADLSSIGLSGTGLAFIAFPIAISRMAFPFFWAFLFFIMLLCLGIDSEFAMIESVMTVVHDSGMAPNMSKPKLAGMICGISWLMGLIFITRGGIYWFQLFDYYTCICALFFVTFMECFWVMWGDPRLFASIQARTRNWTGRRIPPTLIFAWKWLCPVLTGSLFVLALGTNDLMRADVSKPYPEGGGLLPHWSIGVGWKLGLVPVATFAVIYIVQLETDVDHEKKGMEHDESTLAFDDGSYEARDRVVSENPEFAE